MSCVVPTEDLLISLVFETTSLENSKNWTTVKMSQLAFYHQKKKPRAEWDSKNREPEGIL